MSDEEDTITSIPPPDSGEIEFGSELPVLPIRNAVLFPAAVAPFDVGREKSVALVEDIENLDQPIIAIMAQRDPATDDPDQNDLYPVGVAARVLKALKHSSGNYSLILQGLVRIRLEQVVTSEPYMRARVSRLEEPAAEDVESEALAMSLRDIAKQVIQLMPELPREAGSLIDSIQEHGQLADLVAANLDAPVEEKSQLLETLDAKERIRKVLRLLTRQLEILKMRERINSQIKEEMGKNQREYVLRQQLKAIKEELGEEEGDQGDLDVLEERLAKANLPSEADAVAHKQLKRLRQMQVGSAEYTVVRTYIDWILDIPWSKQTADNMDIAAVRKVLDEDHSGLEKVKKRIVEYLAVRKLKTDKKGPILCLIGPPGVGKTSLGRSVARALGRKFHRISLGGVHDEAAIRGHRRTYVGALPGQVIQGMKKASTINPVFMLDEIDKIGHDFRGDPAGALLEVLDPEQNNTFHDHYLDVEYDLSKVLFICTANVTHPIPPALLDRMEKIQLSGYTHHEKLEIARGFLVPRQTERHGLKKYNVEFTEEGLLLLIERYTREAGVRNLEREIASICRKVARKVLKEKMKRGGTQIEITPEFIGELLGKPRYRKQRREQEPEVGAAAGLAWTQVGGELLITEATLMRGKANVTLTGQLGDVMQESARAALSFVRSRADKLGIDPEVFATTDVHVHVPEGAIPKDGPSAGITIAATLVSAFTNVPVRVDIAMTGEITLRGQVLPVGGIKEKVLAAFRAGIREVILPEENEKDLEEIPEDVRDQMRYHFVSHMDKVLSNALVRDLDADVAAAPGDSDSRVDSPPLAH